MTATAADIPAKYDIVIDGQGYIYLRTIDPSLPFRVQKAAYTFSPTFVERSNVQGDYGDNQQDFWMTFTQRDLLDGEQQRFYRSTPDRQNRFWRGTNIDIRTAGQATMRPAVMTDTLAALPDALCGRGAVTNQDIVATAGTHLYEIAPGGAITDQGAHGLGTTPFRFGLVSDGVNVYLSSTAGGSVGVRKWTGAAFSTFSATTADSLEFLNNTLYALRGAAATEFGRYDTAGVWTSLYVWKTADGTARGGIPGRLRAYGSKLLMLWATGARASELWLYDGVAAAPSLIGMFPGNFMAYDIEVDAGVAYISGSFVRVSGSNNVVRPALFVYRNGNLDLIWQADDYLSTTAVDSALPYAFHPALAAFDGGIVFNDDFTARLMFYDPATGGVHGLGAYGAAATVPVMAATQKVLAFGQTNTTLNLYPNTASIATTSTITLSLADFDTSLSKLFRGIVVDADIPTGATVDIAYQLETVDSVYATLQTNAVSGTEYGFGGTVVGRSITLKITLNKGSSATGPVFKRAYVRASPLLQAFAQDEVVLDCSGRNGLGPLVLNDGSAHPLDGMQMATNLRAAAASRVPITISDRFSTFTSVIEPDKFEMIEVRPEEFVARMTIRQV